MTDQIIHELILYLNCIFEIFLLYDFLRVLFPLYEERKNIRILEIIGCATIVYAINIFKIPAINLFCVPLADILLVWLVFRLDAKQCILYAIFYYMILAATEFAFYNIYGLVGVDITQISVNRIFFLVIQDIMRFIIVQLIKRQHHFPYESDSYRYTKCLLIFPITALVLLNGLLEPMRYPYSYLLISIGGVLLLVSSTVTFSVVEKLIDADNLIKENEMMIMKTELEQNHYRRMEEVNQEYAEYIHEMRHIMQTLEQLSSTDQTEMVKQLSVDASRFLMKKSPVEEMIYINDTIANAVFVDRRKKCEELGINCSLDIQPGISLDFISDLDKIRMFGNLLDNAVEGAVGCENAKVSVNLYRGNDSIIIFKVVNNYRRDCNKQGNLYLSTKQEKSKHGFGLKNVQKLAEKYHGFLHIMEGNEMFQAILILSNIQKMEKS